MHIHRKRPWDLPEHAATPEHVFLNRRNFLVSGAAALTAPSILSPALAQEADPSTGLYPAKQNGRYQLDGRDITPEAVNANYNNFYEFGSSKRIASAAQALKIRPWTIRIDGMVDKEQTIGIDDLLKKVELEERLYRHRCVEAWSMTVPWSGFPLKALVAIANPAASAKYIRFETFMDPKMAPGQRQTWYPWPYTEGVTMAEAANELAFLVTGAYGKPLAKSFGAPIRLALPWKYGFKHIKSISRVTFTDQRPKTFWEQLQSAEYGFWANVNPQVAHPRWSQADEEVLGTNGKRIPTVIFNGYGEYVADLYKGMEKERLWA
ncbi:MAG: protein-methionine-sulfoxide reductase catalytic subunit MsrP [Methylocystis sp.]|nr:protein-methionine-sulfoxide reductase catalytic subunit MsrP [Methylocystis sp.]MCA3582714.1 protein-methionine-sulfoxide reductase catalytic subunit MsrP [Methylocystis sp.]MCA3587080.1 protein-methionine-sulfoxide reductase catalytic subunit MsrP [Methylocystis sp.]MCA3592011.1 protein-methionine-sulfoxide reductase catalytic subunit MsrP [Methylocystis sp.]